MSRWEVVISCWVVELFDCSAEFSSNVWSIQIRNESSPRQQSEFFGCLAENIRLSWFIQKKQLGNDQFRPLTTTIFVPTEDWPSNLSTPSQSLFGKREFYRLKYIRAYVETAHASAVKSEPRLLALPPGSSSPVNQNKQIKIIKRYKETR